jgi:hypothetical protein
VVGRTVEHRVTLSHNPALVGTVQVRRIQMTGRRLTLSAEEVVPGGRRVHRLQWRPAVRPRNDEDDTARKTTSPGRKSS